LNAVNEELTLGLQALYSTPIQLVAITAVSTHVAAMPDNTHLHPMQAR